MEIVVWATLVCASLLKAANAQGAEEPIYYGACTLPDGVTAGVCTQIRYCPNLLSKIRKSGPLLIKPFLCNQGGRKTSVCCSKEDSLLNSECGHSFTLKISGGVNATAGDWPYAALIQYTDGRKTSWGCGGSLINERYVLTAAHCVDTAVLGNKYKITLVRLGENNLDTLRDPVGQFFSDPPQDIEPEEIIVHPDFSLDQIPGIINDVALIRLKIPATLTDYVRPVCLPDETEQEREGFATVIGWGFLGSDKRTTSTLQRLQVPIVPLPECNIQYRTKATRPLSPNYHLCAGGVVGEDSCKGDSGGPLLQGDKNGIYTQIGIVSFGAENCSDSNLPGVYAKVSRYVSWIKLHLRP